MIIIEGVMGVGKSTLQREICQRVKMSYGVVQDFEHNVCLKDFYEGDFAYFKSNDFLIFRLSCFDVFYEKTPRENHDIRLLS